MRDFFKGWKPKVGCVTLVMACVFAAGWVISATAVEVICIPVTGSTACGVISADCHIVLGVNQSTDKSSLPASPYWIKTDFQTIDSILDGESANTIVDLRLYRIGLIAIGTPDAGSLLLMAPYWSIVCPLTLLSAYLLLSKPRPAKKLELSQATEPDHA